MKSKNLTDKDINWEALATEYENLAHGFGLQFIPTAYVGEIGEIHGTYAGKDVSVITGATALIRMAFGKEHQIELTNNKQVQQRRFPPEGMQEVVFEAPWNSFFCKKYADAYCKDIIVSPFFLSSIEELNRLHANGQITVDSYAVTVSYPSHLGPFVKKFIPAEALRKLIPTMFLIVEMFDKTNLQSKPNKPPDRIDGAKVIEWAYAETAPFSVLKDENGVIAAKIHGLAICQYDSGEIYRFSCDQHWVTQQDTPHDSVEEAKMMLSKRYQKNAAVRWVKMKYE